MLLFFPKAPTLTEVYYNITIFTSLIMAHTQTHTQTTHKNCAKNEFFSVHTTPEEFENATITGYFGFVFEENSDREIT